MPETENLSKQKIDWRGLSAPIAKQKDNGYRHGHMRTRYHFAATSKIEQAQALIETDYEFVTDMDGMKLFRKPR